MPEAPADNVFAKILKGELPCHAVYGDEDTFAFLDIYPQSPGHTLVLPRNYCPNLFEADSAAADACLATVRRIAPAIAEVVEAAGITVITNTGREAGQMIEYLHFHIIPRFAGDEVNLHRLGPQEPPEVLEALAERIRRKLGWQTQN